MNILMMTNTYLPFIGGVERSVQIFSNEFRRMGHRVLIVAPSFADVPEQELDVIRVPALQRFNGTDFSVQLPIPGILSNTLKQFRPDIVHSHHPFMIGDSALRVAAQFKTPIVFTFHTYYERYTHYVPGDSPALKRFVSALATGYANLCDHVFAPSHDVAQELRRRGVVSAIDVVPTGIELNTFAHGNGREFRERFGIPLDAFVVGFVSRIAPEKNVAFLTEAVKWFLSQHQNACFLLIGDGPLMEKVKGEFSEEVVQKRFFHTGTLIAQSLVDAYHAMDVFVFASQTETQGLVVTEAMAAGLPVVALRGPGIGEVVQEQQNGRLVELEEVEVFGKALEWVAGLSPQKLYAVKNSARHSVMHFSQEVCAARALMIYETLLSRKYMVRDHVDSAWEKAKRMIKAELELLKNMTRATGAAIGNASEQE